MWTELEVWSMLSDRNNWRKLEGNVGFFFECDNGEIFGRGLCVVIESMLSARSITQATYESMMQKIKEGRGSTTNYFWSAHTEEGNQERRQFCSNQASKLSQVAYAGSPIEIKFL